MSHSFEAREEYLASFFVSRAFCTNESRCELRMTSLESSKKQPTEQHEKKKPAREDFEERIGEIAERFVGHHFSTRSTSSDTRGATYRMRWLHVDAGCVCRARDASRKDKGQEKT